MREGHCRRARGGPGLLCVGKRTTREGHCRRARARKLWPFLRSCRKTTVREGKAAARSAAMVNSAWENTQRAMDKAAARAAALAVSV